MTPTLWPGFSPSRLQPANFLASKAIWYPAARQRCGSDREARVGPGALGNRKHILCPLRAQRIPLPHLGEAANPSPDLQCWGKAGSLGAGFSPCGPGQPQNGRMNPSGSHVKCKEPAHPTTPPPPTAHWPTGVPTLPTRQDTQAQRKTHVHE